MARVVGIGHQDFGHLIQNDYFYVDKTGFIKEWWENGDRADLFQGLSIWQDKTQDKSAGEDYKYRKLQGTYPVISLSFAKVKESDFPNARKQCDYYRVQSEQPQKRKESGRDGAGRPGRD